MSVVGENSRLKVECVWYWKKETVKKPEKIKQEAILFEQLTSSNAVEILIEGYGLNLNFNSEIKTVCVQNK